MKNQSLIYLLAGLGLSLTIGLIQDVQAQNQNMHRRNTASQENRLDQNFPGIGSIDDYRSAVPVMQDGMEKLNFKDPEQAKLLFNKALSIYPYMSRCYFGLGRCVELSKGKNSEAESLYRKGLSIDSKDWKCWQALGDLLFREKRYEDAEVALRSSLAAGPPAQERRFIEDALTTTISEKEGLGQEVAPGDEDETK